MTLNFLLRPWGPCVAQGMVAQRLVTQAVIALVMTVGGLQPLSAADPKFRLQERARSGDVTRVQSVLEVSGQLKINPDGKQVVRLPISGKGELLYDEKILAADDAAGHRSVRYYRASHASSRVGERDIAARLDDQRRLIAVQATHAEATLFCPLGPLTREELDLIDLQGNTLLLGRLLPPGEVAIDDTWVPDDGLTAALFKLDVVTENKLVCALRRIENKTAFLEMSGTVQGSVAGVGSKIEVNSKFNFDIALERITWLAIAFKEEREVGHAEPGFELTARLRTALAAGQAGPELADGGLASLPLVPDAGNTMLTFTSEIAGIRFVHDRSWRVMIDRNDVIIMRLVERGELIAQCNISRLTDAVAGKQLSMNSFQSDIQRVLDKNFGQFVEAKESQNERGLRTLRSVVAGVAADLPIQWSYYHLTDSAGHQASLVFTLDTKLVERFAAGDQTLVSSFEFVAPIEGAVAGGASKTARAARAPERQ